MSFPHRYVFLYHAILVDVMIMLELLKLIQLILVNQVTFTGFKFTFFKISGGVQGMSNYLNILDSNARSRYLQKVSMRWY